MSSRSFNNIITTSGISTEDNYIVNSDESTNNAGFLYKQNSNYDGFVRKEADGEVYLVKDETDNNNITFNNLGTLNANTIKCDNIYSTQSTTINSINLIDNSIIMNKNSTSDVNDTGIYFQHASNLYTGLVRDQSKEFNFVNLSALPSNTTTTFDNSQLTDVKLRDVKINRNLKVLNNSGYANTINTNASQNNDLTITLPLSAGSNGAILQTNGTGQTSWSTTISDDISAIQRRINDENVEIGKFAGQNNHSTYGIAIGYDAGRHSQGNTAIALGFTSGHSAQGTGCIAIGEYAGYVTQGQYGIAIGSYAGTTGQDFNSIAIGLSAGSYEQGFNSVAIGLEAGYTNQLNRAVAIGRGAGKTNQGDTTIAIGRDSGAINQQSNAIAMGYNCGYSGQGSYSVAIGSSAGYSNQKGYCIAIGDQAGNDSQQLYSIAIGKECGYISQGNNAVAIGYNAGNSYQNDNCVAIGHQAGQVVQGLNSVAVGKLAGFVNQGNNCVAVGYNAGNTAQGNYSIAIGANAGSSNVRSESIILNANSTTALNSSNSGLYINPVRNDNTVYTNYLSYNTSTKEIGYNLNYLKIPYLGLGGEVDTGKSRLRINRNANTDPAAHFQFYSYANNDNDSSIIEWISERYNGASDRTNAGFQLGIRQSQTASEDKMYLGRPGVSSQDFVLLRDGRFAIGVFQPSYVCQIGRPPSSSSYYSDSYIRFANPAGTTVVETSDERVKENIHDADIDILYENVKNLTLKRFSYKTDIIPTGDRTQIGWIAQQVKEIYPKAVHIEPEHTIVTSYENGEPKDKETFTNFHTLDADQLYKCAFGALQKAIQKIEVLEQKVAYLESIL